MFIWLTILSNLAGIIFLSQSTMVTLWLIFTIMYLIIAFLNIKLLVLSPLVISSILIYIYNFVDYEKWRVFILFDKIFDLGFEKVIYLIHLDWSINVGVTNVIFQFWVSGRMVFDTGIQSWRNEQPIKTNVELFLIGLRNLTKFGLLLGHSYMN